MPSGDGDFSVFAIPASEAEATSLPILGDSEFDAPVSVEIEASGEQWRTGYADFTTVFIESEAVATSDVRAGEADVQLLVPLCDSIGSTVVFVGDADCSLFPPQTEIDGIQPRFGNAEINIPLPFFVFDGSFVEGDVEVVPDYTGDADLFVPVVQVEAAFTRIGNGDLSIPIAISLDTFSQFLPFNEQEIFIPVLQVKGFGGIPFLFVGFGTVVIPGLTTAGSDGEVNLVLGTGNLIIPSPNFSDTAGTFVAPTYAGDGDIIVPAVILKVPASPTFSSTSGFGVSSENPPGEAFFSNLGRQRIAVDQPPGGAA
jgi:hypothetical protein